MTIKTNPNDGTATLTVDLKELATITCALGAYAASSSWNVAQEDIERSNEMEQVCFQAFVKLDEGTRFLIT